MSLAPDEMSSAMQASSQIPSPANPPPSAKDSPTVIAWRHALDTYRKSLTDKDLKQLQVPAGPEDVVASIEKWQMKQKNKTSEKIASAIRAYTGRMQRFNACIDVIAQGTPQPGCLLWGSIRLVLTVCWI
jgi:fungal STAND N-terminal Goodbye domain